jgi:rhodanese-related sulfurtransferase/DNA-binding transcriptional ArsR family regulator
MTNPKAPLYDQVARISKALASPKRLELLDLLAQGAKTVEQIALEAQIDIKLASAHLKSLKAAHLVESQRDGKFMVYALSGDDLPGLLVRLREVAESHLIEFSLKLAELGSQQSSANVENHKTLLKKIRAGEAILLDVRPTEEYNAGHLPMARSVPIGEIRAGLKAIPADVDVVAYCRGPFCRWSDEAIEIFKSKGFNATKLSYGVSEWQAAGFSVEVTPSFEIAVAANNKG